MLNIGALKNISTLKLYKSGTVIIDEYSNLSKEMFILVSGTVGVFRNLESPEPIQINTLHEGDIFGELSVFTDEPRSAAIVALSAVSTILITKEHFPDFVRLCPELATQLIESLCVRLSKANSMIMANKLMDGENISSAEKTPALAGKTSALAGKTPALAGKTSALAGKTPALPGKTPVLSDKPLIPPIRSPFLSTAEIKEVLEMIFPEGHKRYPGVMPEVYDKVMIDTTYTCPNCKKKFTAKKTLMSQLKGSRVSMGCDMRVHNEDFDIIWNNIIVCPHCYSCTFEDYYDDDSLLRKDMNIKNALERARECKLLDFKSRKTLDFVFTTHYLALLSAKNYYNERQIKAKLWLQLTYLYSDVDDKEMYRYAVDQAMESYIDFYGNSHMSPEKEQVCCLVMAHLSMEKDDLERAMQYLSIAKLNKEGRSIYKRMAESKMEDLRELRRSRKENSSIR